MEKEKVDLIGFSWLVSGAGVRGSGVVVQNPSARYVVTLMSLKDRRSSTDRYQERRSRG